MTTKDVVLILQIGSLGDTVISLPCYREIARRHPDADRYLLTNYPIGSKMVPAEAILKPTGVIVGSIEYPMPLRQLGPIITLRRQIAALKPSIMYYLMHEVRLANLIRHYAFFKACGIRRIIGIPWSRDMRFSRELRPGGVWESEASRLLRTIGAQDAVPSDADRDLGLSQEERDTADRTLSVFGPSEEFVAISVGGKVPLNNWGDNNWTTMLTALSGSRPRLGAVFVGSADERQRNERLTTHWAGPSVNTCGLLSPRETAAVIARASAFVGHDTGTLHLAGAVDTPVVGIFSARNMPGIWYTDRARDRFFYDRVNCAGCGLVAIEACSHGRICMASHDPAAVVNAVQHSLSR